MLDLQSFKEFTPGPWSAFESDSARFTVERLGSNQFIKSRKIAIVNVDKGNAEANAHLIAAAPDLLALAIKQEAEIKRLKAALAVATDYFRDRADHADDTGSNDEMRAWSEISGILGGFRPHA